MRLLGAKPPPLAPTKYDICTYRRTEKYSKDENTPYCASHSPPPRGKATASRVDPSPVVDPPKREHPVGRTLMDQVLNTCVDRILETIATGGWSQRTGGEPEAETQKADLISPHMSFVGPVVDIESSTLRRYK